MIFIKKTHSSISSNRGIARLHGPSLRETRRHLVMVVAVTTNTTVTDIIATMEYEGRTIVPAQSLTRYQPQLYLVVVIVIVIAAVAGTITVSIMVMAATVVVEVIFR